MPAIDALGSIASEFSKGFLQGRLLTAQKAIQAHQQNLEDIKALSEGADRFKDNPALQEQYLSQLHDALGKLPKPPKTATGSPTDAGSGGIMDFFKSMFAGKKTAQSQQVAPGTPGVGPTAPPAPPSLSPNSPDSFTFGAPGASMTPSPSAGMAAPAPSAESPAFAGGPGLPQGPGLGPVPAPGHVLGPNGTPAPAAAPAVGFGVDTNLPTPYEAQVFGKENWYKDPQYGFVDPKTGQATKPQFAHSPTAEAAMAHRYAYSHAHTALNALDQHIESYNNANPGNAIETEADMLSSPLAGEYKHVSEGIRSYEREGLVPGSGQQGEKGTLDQWRSTAFEDARPNYDKAQHQRDKAIRINSKPDAVITPSERNWLNGYKATLKMDREGKMSPEESETHDVNEASRAVAANPDMVSNPEKYATSTDPKVQQQFHAVTDAQNVLSAHAANIQAADRAKLTPENRQLADWADSYDKATPKPTDPKAALKWQADKARSMASLYTGFHPQQAGISVFPGMNPATQEEEVMAYNRATGKLQSTGAKVKPAAWTPPEKTVRPMVNTPGIAKTDSRYNNPAFMQPGEPVQVPDVYKLIEENRQNPNRVPMNVLEDILQYQKNLPDEDKAELKKYVGNQTRPDFNAPPKPPAR
jgi:hypothetical protein